MCRSLDSSFLMWFFGSPLQRLVRLISPLFRLVACFGAAWGEGVDEERKKERMTPVETFSPLLLPGPFTTELGLFALSTNGSCLEYQHSATAQPDRQSSYGNFSNTHFSPLHYTHW